MSSSSPAKKAKAAPSRIVHYFKAPCLEDAAKHRLLKKIAQQLGKKDLTIDSEWCYNVEVVGELTPEQEKNLVWILKETFEDDAVLKKEKPNLTGADVVEVGPRLCFSTPWSSNAQSVLMSSGLDMIKRVERSRRYKFSPAQNKDDLKKLVELVHDRMTEEQYASPLQTFQPFAVQREKARIIPLSPDPEAALKKISAELGLSFDDWDVKYYADLFQNEFKRDPTDVELFDLAQSNSEHSRHWFFGGNMILDGVPQKKTLFEMVKSTIAGERQRANSIIAFRDNSSAIQGREVTVIIPEEVGKPSRMVFKNKVLHGTFTAETHNFPTGVCPFPGAETGTGGRIRDVQCVGRGARVVAGTAAYCVGQLRMPGEERAPWETEDFQYPPNLALPLDIEIEASNGASDYGNKFGEPVVSGFTRSFGMRLPNGERREWIKPVMFTSGVGFMEDIHSQKGHAETGMLIAKVGGPAYRIGMGGGAASSRMQSDDEKTAKLDFDAVQRGDAEMENKMNRVIRACVELGDKNPIHSIHDQGAGGNGNVLKEICEPTGGTIFLGNLVIGDDTMSARELWTAEYQENNAVLIPPAARSTFEQLCIRERSPFSFVGVVNDSKRVTVYDGTDETAQKVVDFDLEKVLGKLPPKTYHSKRQDRKLSPFKLPGDITVDQCLRRVLTLLSVGSKRFLTNKVDRCVTGLVAQQQCVGPLHTPLADVAVLAQGFFGTTGVATCTGEQPIKGLVDSKAGARMTVGEALSNLVWARVSNLEDVKCRGNWMWPAKLEGEACEMYDTCQALCESLIGLGVAMDGGKDSLSMAATAPGDGVVKAPGQICISCYAMVDDISRTVTPDLKRVSNDTVLLLCEPASRTRRPGCKGRLGGSALAQVFCQLSNDCPDLEQVDAFAACFKTVQSLLDERVILAGHDRSDGGLASCVLEMAFAGNAGCTLDLQSGASAATQEDILRTLFGEELGLVMQVEKDKEQHVLDAFALQGLVCFRIGEVTDGHEIRINVDGKTIISSTVSELRDVWESTSFALEKRQCDEECVRQEQEGLKSRKDPPYSLTYFPEENEKAFNPSFPPSSKPRLAVIREEGSNGDREMCAAFAAADFDVWDVTMDDLKNGRIGLDSFRGLAFVGGFSYADVFGSAKGWGAAARFNDNVRQQLDTFRARKDTFSLGVCNGCQLLALLGWVPGTDSVVPNERAQPRFVHNKSGRFEVRWVTVKIESNTPSMMLKGMGGSVMGVWVAHGEGQAVFPDKKVLDKVEAKGLAPIRYVDDDAKTTQVYPFNPNGSTNGIAALCSEDGRHLALMPHPERCFRMYQMPWMPQAWKNELKASPWMKMFQNARAFCDQ